MLFVTDVVMDFSRLSLYCPYIRWPFSEHRGGSWRC